MEKVSDYKIWLSVTKILIFLNYEIKLYMRGGNCRQFIDSLTNLFYNVRDLFWCLLVFLEPMSSDKML